MKQTFSIVGPKAKALTDALASGTAATLIREPENKFDTFAVAVWIDGQHVGYIPKKAYAPLIAVMDAPGMALDSAGKRSLEAVFKRSPNSSYPQVEVELAL